MWQQILAGPDWVRNSVLREFMKHLRHHLSEVEMTMWVLMLLLLGLIIATGYLFWQKFAM